MSIVNLSLVENISNNDFTFFRTFLTKSFSRWKVFYQQFSHDLEKNGSNRKSQILFAENYEKLQFYQG